MLARGTRASAGGTSELGSRPLLKELLRQSGQDLSSYVCPGALWCVVLEETPRPINRGGCYKPTARSAGVPQTGFCGTQRRHKLLILLVTPSGFEPVLQR